ncbi:MAG: HD domain-containing phosphohydrolase [Bacillota bacterium]
MSKNILSDKAGGVIYIGIITFIVVINMFVEANPFINVPALYRWVLLILLVYLGLSLLVRALERTKTAKSFSRELELVHQKMVVVMEGISIEQAAETSEHIRNVSDISYLLAKAYGLSDEESELLRLASPLHDVGKCAVPPEILNKPSRLNEREYEIMKTHSQAGHNALKDTDHRILDIAAIIALQHHEKFNGRGYPNGLIGDEIHIYAQITALADVYDALLSPRVYKMAYSVEETIRIIKRERGEHFNPKLVDLFLQIIEKQNLIERKTLTKIS